MMAAGMDVVSPSEWLEVERANLMAAGMDILWRHSIPVPPPPQDPLESPSEWLGVERTNGVWRDGIFFPANPPPYLPLSETTPPTEAKRERLREKVYERYRDTHTE